MPATQLFSKRFFYAYLAILIWAPLPYASTRDWASNLLSLLVMSLAAVMVITLLARDKDCITPLRRHWLPVSIFLLVPFWVTLQTYPLPAELISSLSPTGGELQHWADLERYTISLEPNATRREALLSWSYWLFFVMTLLLVDSAQRSRTLVMTVVLCGVFQALYGSFMTLSGIGYGFFEFRPDTLSSASGTFLVRNHFAGYLEMCLSLGIGLLVGTLSAAQSKRTWRQRFVESINTILGPKMRLRIGLALMVIALVLSRSRMGNTAFFISLPLCGVLFMVLQRKLHKGAIILFTSLILIDVMIVSEWFGLEEVAQRLQATSTNTEIRDEIIRDDLIMLPDFQLSGSGLGTFMHTFIAYDNVHTDRMVDFAHNDFLEFLIELGWLGYAPMALLVLYSLIRSMRAIAVRKTKLYRGIGFGVLMGITSLLIHSMVDFNLQIPANAMLFVLLLALAQLAFTLERGESGSRHRRNAT